MIFRCDNCGYTREVPHRYAGKAGKCPQCQSTSKVGGRKSAGNTRHSITDFVNRTSHRGRGDRFFEMESERLLEVRLSDIVWTKAGAMVAYRGNIKFTREGVLEEGLGQLLKKTITGEGPELTKAEGRGTLYLADSGKKISILKLQNESLFVNGNDLLAFEDEIVWDIKLMKTISGMLAGGLFNVKLEGTGMIAITTHHDPITLRVSSDKPVFTDPNATVAWSGRLSPELKTDISVKTFIGRGSGESIQMKFQGEGFVVIQPYEEVSFRSR